MTLSSQVRWF